MQSKLQTVCHLKQVRLPDDSKAEVEDHCVWLVHPCNVNLDTRVQCS